MFQHHFRLVFVLQCKLHFFVVSVTVVGITGVTIKTKIVHYYNGKSSQNFTKLLLLV